MSEKHFERFGIKYVAQNIAAEAGMMKRMLDEYGAEAVKEFIDRSLHLYKPSPRYPGINFATMVRFYKSELTVIM
jgi:hypothetical protein